MPTPLGGVGPRTGSTQCVVHTRDYEWSQDAQRPDYDSTTDPQIRSARERPPPDPPLFLTHAPRGSLATVRMNVIGASSHRLEPVH